MFFFLCFRQGRSSLVRLCPAWNHTVFEPVILCCVFAVVVFFSSVCFYQFVCLLFNLKLFATEYRETFVKEKPKADLLWSIKSHAYACRHSNYREWQVFVFFPGSFRRSVERIKNSGYWKYQSHFHVIFGPYISPNLFWSWCACLFSLNMRSGVIERSSVSGMHDNKIRQLYNDIILLQLWILDVVSVKMAYCAKFRWVWTCSVKREIRKLYSLVVQSRQNVAAPAAFLLCCW